MALHLATSRHRSTQLTLEHHTITDTSDRFTRQHKQRDLAGPSVERSCTVMLPRATRGRPVPKSLAEYVHSARSASDLARGLVGIDESKIMEAC
jgi:hypothetical protein